MALGCCIPLCQQQGGQRGDSHVTMPHAQPVQPIVDVIIVGCGPVGAFSALLLRSMGMRCLVIERDADACECNPPYFTYNTPS